jgi:hypothetical protein
MDLAVAFGANPDPVNGPAGVSILMGVGDGTFRSKADYPSGGVPLAVAVGDFYGDGHQDLVVANGGKVCGLVCHQGDTVGVLVGNGDGTFQPAIVYVAGSEPASLTTGDFNRDGKLDLAVANVASNTMSVFLNNGTKSTVPPDFLLSLALANLTVPPGGQGSDKITIAPQNGPFGNTIQLTCAVTGPAPRPTCSLSPSSVTPGPNSVTSMLTITAPIAATQLPREHLRFLRSLYVLWLPLMFGVSVVRPSTKYRRRYGLFCGWLLLLFSLQIACGGGGTSTNNAGTSSPTNYTVTLTGTSATIQHTAQVAVTVE